MDDRIAVNFRSRSLHDLGPVPKRQIEHIDGAQYRCFGSFDRIELIEDRRSRTGQIVDFIDLGVVGQRNIVLDKRKTRIGHQRFDITHVPREEIIETDNFVPLAKQSFAKV